MQDVILKVSGLGVSFGKGSESCRVVDGVSFEIRRGEMLALVGESGSGKSVTALTVMGLLPEASASVESGEILFHGKNLLAMDDEEMNGIRGKRISMIFQEPMTALNPVFTAGWQLCEVLKQHEGLSEKAAEARAIELLEEVEIPDARRRFREYPHQLSGGMRQRVMIAMALACRPELLIADEPTTALDVTVQAQIMELLGKLRREYGTAVLLITHNLALVREQAERAAVMYGGNIVEYGRMESVFTSPCHPYTELLLKSVPAVGSRGTMLSTIPGHVPASSKFGWGCRFAERCPLVTEKCRKVKPELREISGHLAACHALSAVGVKNCTPAEPVPAAEVGKVILEARNLKVHFPVARGMFFRKKAVVHAVDGVDFSLMKGETLALVGESGCGKTTAGKALAGLADCSSGSIVLDDGTELAGLYGRARLPYRRRIQMIFQDPYGSLDPRLMIGETLSEGLDAYRLHRNDRREYLAGLLEAVGLPAEALSRYPHQFSGGQRQRIGIARALALEPEIVVCDECTSALDVSVQAQILNLLRKLQRERGLAYLFITHDLSVVGYLADRVAVMYLGKIVEEGRAAEVLEKPCHPYTRALLAAAPKMSGEKNGKLRLSGELPSPLNPPDGCAFHTRCPYATEECRTAMPSKRDVTQTHSVCCHRTGSI